MERNDDGFKFRRAVRVRFQDVDGMGHAHHAAALVYFEEARAAYWTDVAERGAGIGAIDYVMGEVSVRYHGRVRWPGTLDVGVRVTRLGRSSFDMIYEARDEDGVVVLTGSSSQVMFDYGRGESLPMPADLRAKLLAFDGPAERT